MGNSIDSEAEILKTCYKVFVDRAMDWYGLSIHHVKIDKRKDSIMCVDTNGGGYKTVPVLEVYFREETFKKVVDDRKQITNEVSDNLRDMWWDILHSQENNIERNECFDERMIIHAFSYEQRCFYDFISNCQNEVSDLLKEKLGKRPQKVYPSYRGLNIVYETADYMFLGIEPRAKSLEAAIYKKAQDYVVKKYSEKMDSEFNVKFWHPNMSGYNGYWLWLG